MPSKTIFFVHGNFVNYQCWDLWVNHYQKKGYTCVASSFPLRDKPVEELRKIHPDPKLGALAIGEVLEHLTNEINKLKEKPIIIGHSFGGLLTQLLINKGLGAAGVAIDSVPPLGVITTKFSFIRSLWPIVNPFHPASRPYLMSFEHFQYTFTNGQPLEEQKQAYDAYVVPESVRLSRGALSGKASVDFKKPHVPLLLIGGEIDHIMPASLNRSNFNRYKASAPSVTDYKEFPGRNHFTVIGGKGWDEVADYALNWVESKLS